MQEEIGFEVPLSRNFDTSIQLVTEALKQQGFGILTRIDVREILKTKLDVDFRPYVILGACNPPLAHKALTSDARVGLMLPCNVTVEAVDDDHTLVRFANPALMVQFVDNPDEPGLQSAAHTATQKICMAIDILKQA